MNRTRISTLIILMAITVFIGCSDFYTYEPVRIELLSLENGDILKKNDDVYFKIIVDDTDTKPQSLIIDLKNSKGQVMASNTLQSPEINTELVLNDLINKNIDLPYGEYSLVFRLSTGQEVLAQNECIFFYVNEDYSISGVWSYPWLIEPKDKALLIADLKIPDSLNPYIRWSQNGVVIAKGLLHDGFDQILWETPPKEGVYSITVELFPFAPPTSSGYTFDSKTSMSAELYVSSPVRGKAAEKKKDLFYNLFEVYLHSKDTLSTSNAAVANTRLKKPKIVLNDDIIGFKLDGNSGFICDDLIVPIKNNRPRSFNLSLGITPQGEQVSKTVFYSYSENGSFSLRYYFNEKQIPAVTMTINGVTHTFVSGIDTLKSGRRVVIDFSLVFQDEALKAVWKLDGKQVSAAENAFTESKVNQTGFSIIGGGSGINGIIDTLDVTLLEDKDISLLSAPSGPMLAKRLK